MILADKDQLRIKRRRIKINPRDWLKRYRLSISTPFFSSCDEQLRFFDELTDDLNLTKGSWSFHFTKIYAWKTDQEPLVKFRESETIIIKFSRKCDAGQIGLKWA